jgi:hypothetical protein
MIEAGSHTATSGVEDLDDLDDAGLLEAAAEAERRDRMVQREKLALAYQWCVRHPATSESGAATWGDAGLPGLSECDASLGGQGTPGVAPFVAEALGAAMGVSTQSAMSLMADALDLRHRLPRLWALVESLAVAPWKARRVATETRTLPYEGAHWVDDQLAARIDGFGLPTIERTLALAAARYAPEELAQREQTARAGWHVTLTHPRPGDFTGTSWLDVAGDSKDLSAFHDLVCAEATQLGRLGDADDYQTRKAKALGIIAARQAHLDLPAPNHTSHTSHTSDASGAVDGDPPRPRPTVKTTLYLHLTTADLTADLTIANTGGPAVGEAERLGPVTTDLIRSWLQDCTATIQPVLDLDRDDAVDPHDPPPWMRELVILRDRHCVFPWCGRHARSCDLDHIIAYDPDGPPGQTRPDNLAPLCRRHHNAKTFGRWRYHRDPDGPGDTYTWRSPQGDFFQVTPDGTHALGPADAIDPHDYTLAT